MPTVLWVDNKDYTKVILTKDTDETMIISIGDFITYKGRPDGVRVEGFTRKERDVEGPIGMTYLPWRKEQNKWATLSWSIMRGNNRHLIAFPCGQAHWGEHIDWNTMSHFGECPPYPQQYPSDNDN